jgi:hypothetical protein
MIQLQSDGDLNPRVSPVFVCDICHEPITKVGKGAAAFRSNGLGEGETYKVLHVHKGGCHNTAEKQVVGERGGVWHELADHLNDVAVGLGVTIRSMVNREVAWAAVLTPTENAELQERLLQLTEWLRQHGIDSPLLR